LLEIPHEIGPSVYQSTPGPAQALTPALLEALDGRFGSKDEYHDLAGEEYA
jgi:hypothetical protein